MDMSTVARHSALLPLSEAMDSDCTKSTPFFARSASRCESEPGASESKTVILKRSSPAEANGSSVSTFLEVSRERSTLEFSLRFRTSR